MFRDLLIEWWDEAETGGLNPAIEPTEPDGLSMNRGWYSGVDFDPHVALVNFRENISGGGNTLYSGIDPSGGGPTQERIGYGSITVFAERDREYGTGNFRAAKMVDEIRKHIERITINAESSDRDIDYGSEYPAVNAGAPALPGPWTHVATRWEGSAVDDDKTPPVEQSEIRVRYSWHRVP